MSNLRKLFWAGGLVAGVLLIVAGALWIWQGVDGRNEVHATITREQIVGSPDMSPEAIKEGIAKASATISDVAGAWVKDQSVDIANGKVTGYRVTMKLTFVLHKPKSKKK